MSAASDVPAGGGWAFLFAVGFALAVVWYGPKVVHFVGGLLSHLGSPVEASWDEINAAVADDRFIDWSNIDWDELREAGRPVAENRNAA